MRNIVSAACCAAMLCGSTTFAQTYLYQHADQDGNVHVPAFVLPPSPAISEQARRHYVMAAHGASDPPDIDARGSGIDAYRKHLDDTLMRPMAERALALHKVELRDASIAGVRVKIVTPEGGIDGANVNRVLINLHGGAWMVGGGGWQGLVESVPVAAVAGMMVIAVDYRQWPEARHPAATEDAIAVFEQLATRYPRGNIGLYGCSAGGMLVAMVTARLLEAGKEPPGAIGIYGAGATRSRGDSFVIAAALSGVSLPLDRIQDDAAGYRSGYFEGSDPAADRTLSPADHPDLLRRFPSTQLITGARALDLSPAIITHAALIEAGAAAELHVREGMGHCFITRSDLPEAQAATRAIAAFFDRNLGRTPLRKE